MACEKCGYRDKNEKEKHGIKLCPICFSFAPNTVDKLKEYSSEKLDWKVLETFRKYFSSKGDSQKKGMSSSAEKGKLVTRPPKGYSISDGKLVPNQDALKVHEIFREFSKGEISLNKLSKKHNLSVNGLKKILKNRTYLGEIKFAGKLFKGNHKPIIDEELFYEVERTLSNR